MNSTLKKILSTVAALLLVATAGAQQQRITMSATRLPLGEALAQIHRQTGLGIAYNPGQVDPARTASFPQTALTLDEALAAMLAGTGLSHGYEGRMIVLTQAPEAPRPAPHVARRYAARDFARPLGNRPVPQTAPAAPAPVPVPVAETPAPVSKWREASTYTATQGALPRWALKTNLLYGLGTLTPNLGIEAGLGPKTTLEFTGSYNPWNLSGSLESNKKFVHMILKPEFRYWLCERFDGHFFGVHALYGRYNIGSVEVPLLFEKEYRYDGRAYGGGITYGYNVALSKRWAVELAVGVGAVYLDYDRFDCAACDRDPQPLNKTYFGPTDASISLVFLIK